MKKLLGLVAIAALAAVAAASMPDVKRYLQMRRM
jgi:hypothetical protein